MMLIRPVRTSCVYGIVFLAGVFVAPFANAQTHNKNTFEKKNDEIIVTGSLLFATSNENLSGVSVLTREELQRRRSGSLGETLKFEPGISSSFFGAGASRPIIRGQGGLRVLLLDNGIGSIDASSASPDHAAALEPAMASRIEVIRGSGLLRYGSAASGGVVNVIDGRIPETVPDKPVIGSARIGTSSVDNGYEIAVGSDVGLGALGEGDVVAHAELSHRITDNYNIPDFARSKQLRQLDPMAQNQEVRKSLPNSSTQATSLAVGVSYIAEGMFFGSAIKVLTSEYGIPGGEGATISLDQTRYDFSSRFDFANRFAESLRVSGGAANYVHTEIEASGEIGTVFRNKGYEGRAEIIQNSHGAWQAAHGVQYKVRDFSAVGDEAFVPPTTTYLFGAFSFHELEFGPVHMEAAARYEQVKHVTDFGIHLGFNGLSGSFGMDTDLTASTKLGLSVYRTERAPTTEELFSNGPHLATNQFELGDINLGKEIAMGAEMSLRYADGGHHLTVNVFYTKYADYVYEADTGMTMITDEGDRLSIARFTPSDAVFKGLEIDIARDLGEWRGLDIKMDTSLEYVEARLTGPVQGGLPRIPPLGLTFGIDADAQDWGVRAELEYANSQKHTAFGELPSNSYVLFNGFMTYAVNENITLRLSAHNITNQDARQHTSFLKEQLPLPGRNFDISLSAIF